MDEPSIAKPSSPPPRPPNRALEGVLIGLVCGAIVWAIVQAVHPVFAVPEQYHIAGIGAPVERHEAFRQQQDIVDRRHMMLYLGLLGVVLGAALGTRLGRSWRAAILAGIESVAGAALAGALASLYFIAMRNQTGQGDLLPPLVRQLLIGVPIGIFLGLGLGLARGSWSAIGRGLAAGALGGVLFSVAYTLLVALCLPAANTESLLPEEPPTRLLWLTTLAASLGLLTGFTSPKLPQLQTSELPS